MKYFFLKASWILLSLLPLWIMYRLSDALFYLLYYVLKYRRPVTRKNLSESFPEKSEVEIARIEKRFYRFLVDTFFETCKLATLSQKQIRRHMKFNNLEEVNADLNNGKSISLYVGHYGSWEWYSSMTLHFPPQIARGQVYQRLHNSLVDKLMQENRRRLGAENVEMHDTLRWIHKLHQQGTTSFLGYIADQSPSRHQIQHYVQFLNHYVPALTGTEKITKKYGFEVYYLDVKRMKRGYYEATFVKMHEHPQTLPNFQLTDLFYLYLEKSIRQQPELYLWTHKRFKFAK
ncbi:MAG: lysophospholipid acyltransferase family protein [Candidatus Symbiothrix sp.]|nr:lysophospholipid acyltransferase family protein [Candidatus Symbiothrix sp.]